MGNDHYISQFYLKRFGFANCLNSKQFDVFVYFLEKGLCKQKGIKNIAYEVNLFSDEIEHGFSVYENRFNKLISSIESSIATLEKTKKPGKEFTNEDIFLLAKFIEFQLRRSLVANPLTKKGINTKSDELIEYVKGLNLKDFSKTDFENHIKATIFQHVTNHFSEKFFTGYKKEEGASMMDMLLSKGWYIFYLSGSKRHQFITSDFPIYAINQHGEGNGVKNPGTMLFMPLSPNILIVNYGYGNKETITFSPVTNRNFTKDINMMLASNAINMIFGREQRLVEWYGKYRNRNTSSKFPKWMTHEPNIPIEEIKHDLYTTLEKHGRLVES